MQERNATLVEGSFAGVSIESLVTTPSEPSVSEPSIMCLLIACYKTYLMNTQKEQEIASVFSTYQQISASDRIQCCLSLK